MTVEDERVIDPDTGRREPVAVAAGPARILVDGSIVEVFGGAGTPTTSRHYPTATSQWEVKAPDGYQAWQLG